MDILKRLHDRSNSSIARFDDELLILTIFELEKLYKENKELKEEQELRFQHYLDSNGIMVEEY